MESLVPVAAQSPTHTVPLACPAPDAVPFAPSIPVNERFSSPAPTHTLVGLHAAAAPAEAVPTVPARRRPPAEQPAATASIVEPATHSVAPAALPDAPGWRPVERTEPASPVSKSPSELRRLAEALPSLPPAPVLPIIEEPPTSVIEAVPPVERSSVASELEPTRDAPSPLASPASEAASRLEASPLASSDPESNADGFAASSGRASSAPEESGIFVAAACQAVAPSLLVACRPQSLKPTHYACSPLAQ
jgi:hypothetical protein